MKYLLVLLVWAGSVLPTFSQSEDLTVVLIRHGEKNDATGNLSCKGLNRAMAIPRVLTSKFHQFSYIYVPTVSSGKSAAHARMFQTATPLAVQANLPVNTNFAAGAAAEVARDVLKRTGIVLLVWEHENIPEIAAALGVKDQGISKWSDKDFDSIWVVKYTTSKKGKIKAALKVDKEGVNPPDACSF